MKKAHLKIRSKPEQAHTLSANQPEPTGNLQDTYVQDSLGAYLKNASDQNIDLQHFYPLNTRINAQTRPESQVSNIVTHAPPGYTKIALIQNPGTMQQ